VAAFHLLAPVVGWWPAYVALVAAMGCWQRALATLLHESGHRRLARNRVLNRVCGTYLSGYLIFQGWEAYKASHVDAHHTHLGDPDRDPDLAFQLAQGTYAAHSPVGFAWRFLVAPLLLLKAPAKLVDLFRTRFLAADEPAGEKARKFATVATVFGLLAALGFGTEVLLYWLVPFVTAFPVVGWYLELFEHYPYAADSDTDLYMSRNRWTGWAGKLFLGVFNENYHQTHHLYPQCPFWRLPELHRVLMDDAEYRASQFREIGLLVPVVGGVPSIVSGLLRHSPNRS
jgi:fatty acid desaturase